jgi:hypothetical protein
VIQLSFEGADKYFPNTKSTSPPAMPSSGSPQEVWDQYEKAMREYWDNYRKSMEEQINAAFANVLFLNSDRNIEDFNFPDNVSIPKYSTFSGSLQNLTFSTGGRFDIGVTVTKRDGGVIGYGMSDTTYVLKEAIEVSPPETQLQIENNSIMSGLAWIGLSLPFLLAGLTGLLEIIKHYAFS